MASAFGWSEIDVKNGALNLISSGEMQARIDSKAGVLVAKKKDVRSEAFKKTIEEGEEIRRKTINSQLRFVIFPVSFSR